MERVKRVEGLVAPLRLPAPSSSPAVDFDPVIIDYIKTSSPLVADYSQIELRVMAQQLIKFVQEAEAQHVATSNGRK